MISITVAEDSTAIVVRRFEDGSNNSEHVEQYCALFPQSHATRP